MSGNDGSGNTVERDEWQTPSRLFNKLKSDDKNVQLPSGSFFF